MNGIRISFFTQRLFGSRQTPNDASKAVRQKNATSMRNVLTLMLLPLRQARALVLLYASFASSYSV